MHDSDETTGTPPADGLDPEEALPNGPKPETGEEGRRPTPVRLAMEGTEEDEEERRRRLRTIQDEETGEVWIVTLAGRSASGILPLRTVPLMELNFARIDEPDLPLRRAIYQGDDLTRIQDRELLESLKASAVFREPERERDENEHQGLKRKNRRSSRG
jgi:hypothetical protein